MMMLKNKVADEGMWPVLEKVADLGYRAVEVSQIPMTEENTAALERGIAELGVEVGALSVALKPGPFATGDNLAEHSDKIVADCKRLGCRFVRIGMMPFDAMASKEACEAWAAECEAAAQVLAAHGITLCYHNHHVDLAQFDGERIFDIVRRVAPSVGFEAGFMNAFTNIAQFAEVGSGNMNWPKLLPAALDAGTEYFFVEQDDTYGRDPYDLSLIHI